MTHLAIGRAEERKNPGVSIIMPTYNGARFLGRTIDSVLAQDYPNLELVVVDDGSTDKTPAILASVKDKRLKVLRNDVNRGIPGARNRGLEAARGEYIAFFDHDDIMLPGALRVRARFLAKHQKAGAVFGYVKNTIDGSGRRVKRHRFDNGFATRRFCRLAGELDHAFLSRFYCGFNMLTTAMLRRQIAIQIGRFDENLQMFDCRDYMLRLSRLTPIRFLDYPVLLYRYHGRNAICNKSFLNAMYARFYAKLKRGILR